MSMWHVCMRWTEEWLLQKHGENSDSDPPPGPSVGNVIWEYSWLSEESVSTSRLASLCTDVFCALSLADVLKAPTSFHFLLLHHLNFSSSQQDIIFCYESSLHVNILWSQKYKLFLRQVGREIIVGVEGVHYTLQETAWNVEILRGFHPSGPPLTPNRKKAGLKDT